jgi:Ca2+-binding EF-hand superfamily protein
MKNHSIKSIVIIGSLSLAAVSTAFASEAEDMFKRMDLNGDKKVTAAEHAQFAELSFQQSDADHDGKVSAAECEAAQATYDKKAKIDKRATEAHLRQVDADGDGQISQTENAAFAQSAFARADKNGDGSLSEGEFESAHKAMKKEMKDLKN